MPPILAIVFGLCVAVVAIGLTSFVVREKPLADAEFVERELSLVHLKFRAAVRAELHAASMTGDLTKKKVRETVQIAVSAAAREEAARIARIKNI